jgi:hypothetical protein
MLINPGTLETAKQIIEIAVLIAGGSAVCIAAFVSSRKKYQNGDVVAENNLIVNLRNQIKGYEDVVEKLKNDQAEASRQIANIQGQLLVKDQQLQLFKDIVAGRDPETQKFQQIMLTSVQQTADDRKEMSGIMQKIIHTLGMVEGHLSGNSSSIPTELKIEGNIKPV